MENEGREEFEEVEIKKTPTELRTDSYFDGKLLELIGWKLLCFLIGGITLGIAIPWAECMMYNYRLSHTVYNGKRLKFEGTGGDLFVNRFKWIFFTIITLGIYSFFIPIRKTKWVISHIHFEDEEYNRGESFFNGSTLGLIGVNLLTRIVTILSLGLLYPFMVCFKLRWINKHTVINRKRLIFKGNGLSLLGHYLLWVFLTLITFGIFSWWLKIEMFKWEAKNTFIKKVGEEESKNTAELILIPIIIAVAVIGLFALVSAFTMITGKVENTGNVNYPIKDRILGYKYCEKDYAYDSDDNKCYRYDYNISPEQCEESGNRMVFYGESTKCRIEIDPKEKTNSGHKNISEYENKVSTVEGE